MIDIFKKLLSNKQFDSDTCPELDWLLDFKLSYCQIYITYSPQSLTAWLTIWLPPSPFAFQDGRLKLKTSPQSVLRLNFAWLISQMSSFQLWLWQLIIRFNWNWCALLSLIYLKLTIAVHRLSHENDTWIEGVALTWSPVPHVTVTTLVYTFDFFWFRFWFTWLSLTQSVTGKNKTDRQSVSIRPWYCFPTDQETVDYWIVSFIGYSSAFFEIVTVNQTNPDSEVHVMMYIWNLVRNGWARWLVHSWSVYILFSILKFTRKLFII